MNCERHIGPYPCCSVVEGDCLELMRDLPDGCVDAVITDPPYGVNFRYATHDDTRLGYEDFVARSCAECLRVGSQIAITPGIRNLWIYPRPKWVCCWAKPNSMGRSDLGGFNQWEPILIYGKKIIHQDYFYQPMVMQDDTGNHPCPKPIELIEWLTRKTSEEDATILDPFCGSGTTLVAAKKLGRHFLGFEISAEYCAIARKRLAEIDAQPSLFEPKPEQLKL